MELRFPWLPQTLQHTPQSVGGRSERRGMPPPHCLAVRPLSSSLHPGCQGPCWDLQALLSAWRGGGGGGGLDCCQPGQHLLPTPSPVTGAGLGGGCKTTGGISAARHPPPLTQWMCLSLPRTRKACPLPSVNPISWVMPLSLVGQALGDAKGDEFAAVCPVTPHWLQSRAPSLKFSELCCSGRTGGTGVCGWGWFCVNILIA